MFRKSLFYLAILILLMLVVGCNDTVSQNNNDNDEDSELIQKADNNAIYSILSSKFEIDSHKQITIYNVDERYKLVEALKEDGRAHMGGTFYLLDEEKEKSKELFSEGFPEIEEIYDESVTIKMEHHNGPKGRFYPYSLNIDFETGEQEEEPYYEQLTDFYNREIGGSQQGLGLIETETTEEGIIFKFDETEESFIAGGLYSPDIELSSDSKLKEKYDNEKILGIEFKDTNLADDFLKSDIEEHPKVVNIHVDEYKNALKTNHVFVAIEFSENIEFTGEFEKVERESYMHDFYLIIK